MWEGAEGMQRKLARGNALVYSRRQKLKGETAIGTSHNLSTVNGMGRMSPCLGETDFWK